MIILIVCGCVILIGLIIVIVGTRKFRNTPYKVQTIVLSDGSIQLEVPDFQKKKKEVTESFLQQYNVGRPLRINGKEYRIIDRKKVLRNTPLKSQFVMVIYLQEETESKM